MSNAMYTRSQVAGLVKHTFDHLDAIEQVLYTLDGECADLTTALVVDFAREDLKRLGDKLSLLAGVERNRSEQPEIFHLGPCQQCGQCFNDVHVNELVCPACRAGF